MFYANFKSYFFKITQQFQSKNVVYKNAFRADGIIVHPWFTKVHYIMSVRTDGSFSDSKPMLIECYGKNVAATDIENPISFLQGYKMVWYMFQYIT